MAHVALGLWVASTYRSSINISPLWGYRNLGCWYSIHIALRWSAEIGRTAFYRHNRSSGAKRHLCTRSSAVTLNQGSSAVFNPCNPLIRLIRDSDNHYTPFITIAYYIVLRWSEGFSMKSSCKSLNPENPDSDNNNPQFSHVGCSIVTDVI